MPSKHHRLRRIIKAGGGGQFRGVQRVGSLPAGLRGNRKALPAYYIVYFDSYRTGTTCTMKVSGLTAAQVRQHLIQSNKAFGIIQPSRLGKG